MRDAQEHEQPLADRSGHLAVDADGGTADPLDQGAHAQSTVASDAAATTIAVLQAVAEASSRRSRP